MHVTLQLHMIVVSVLLLYYKIHCCVLFFPYQIGRPKGEVLILYLVIKSLPVTDSDNVADYQPPAPGLCEQRWLV